VIRGAGDRLTIHDAAHRCTVRVTGDDDRVSPLLVCGPAEPQAARIRRRIVLDRLGVGPGVRVRPPADLGEVRPGVEMVAAELILLRLPGEDFGRVLLQPLVGIVDVCARHSRERVHLAGCREVLRHPDHTFRNGARHRQGFEDASSAPGPLPGHQPNTLKLLFWFMCRRRL
jgi:hypothetical protein